jgi:hypothetical protein
MLWHQMRCFRYFHDLTRLGLDLGVGKEGLRFRRLED